VDGGVPHKNMNGKSRACCWFNHLHWSGKKWYYCEMGGVLWDRRDYTMA
jgi:hypothetical protein